MLIPSKLPDETLYSLVSRLAIVNGLEPKHINITSKRKMYQRAADIELDVSEFTRFTNGAYGTVDSLIDSFTFHSAESNHCLIGLSNPNRNIWRWCEECFKEDSRNIGVAYWHHIHQQTCVVTCGKHRVSLMEINIPFRDRQSKFILPRDAMLMHPYSACSDQYINSAIAIANIQSEFNRDSKDFNLSLVVAMLASIPINDHSSALKNYIALTLSNNQPLLEQHIKRELNSDSTALEYLPAKIYAYFSEYDLFKNTYEWHFTMNRGIPLEEDKSYVDIQTRYRNICIGLLDKQATATRTDLWNLNPQCTRWLSRYDSAWFSKAMPNKRRTGYTCESRQKSLFTKRMRSS